MNQTAYQLSLSIEEVGKALAEWTVGMHHEADESLPQRYGSSWRRDWVADVHVRLRYLAQAVAVRRPELFAHVVHWSGTAFAAREVGRDDLLTSLRCLRDVVASELPESAAAEAVRCIDLALASSSDPASPNGRLESPHRELMLKYLEAVLDARRDDAIDLIVAAADGGLDHSTLYMQVLQPAQVEIGRMWHRGEISVADEHLATATTEHVMSLLRTRFDAAPATGRRAVVTGASGDLHSLGARMVAEFLDLKGWQVIYLGANTPGRDVIAALIDHRADLLAVSVTSFLSLRDVGVLIDAIRATPGLEAIKIIVGGAPFNLIPDLWKEIGADDTAESASDAVAVADRLVAGAK